MTILFAIDLTEPDDVIRNVEMLAERLDAQLMVLHVDTPVEDMTGGTVAPLYGAGAIDPYAMYDPATQERLDEAREHAFYDFIHSHFTIPVRPALREGDPAEVILEDAHDQEVDMIVLGKRHHPMLERMLVGSVSKEVLKNTDLPTLLIPVPAEKQAGE